jgi:hypothetical protein
MLLNMLITGDQTLEVSEVNYVKSTPVIPDRCGHVSDEWSMSKKLENQKIAAFGVTYVWIA